MNGIGKDMTLILDKYQLKKLIREALDPKTTKKIKKDLAARTGYLTFQPYIAAAMGAQPITVNPYRQLTTQTKEDEIADVYIDPDLKNRIPGPSTSKSKDEDLYSFSLEKEKDEFIEKLKSPIKEVKNQKK